MRIGIDISSIIYDTGVSWYTKNLTKELLKLDSENFYTLFGSSLRRKDEIAKFTKSLKDKNFNSKLLSLPPTALDFLWNRLHMIPVEKFTGHLDVFHASDWTQPPTRAYKVTTIHDLVPLRYPAMSNPKIVAAHTKRLGWVKKEVDKIIAVSNATKAEIIELLDIPEEKIVVIPEAANGLKRPSEDKISLVKKNYGINKYLLVVGADPRKNVRNIIQAFEKQKIKDKALQLVIVGRVWDDFPKVSGLLELGHVTREELNCLYSGAEALVYASSYEGFGLPLLEAMQLKCPVVTSNISSMPEVAGDAAQLVNPKDPDSISAGITKVLNNRMLYIGKGQKQVKKFTWEKTAKDTLAVYKGLNNK